MYKLINLALRYLIKHMFLLVIFSPNYLSMNMKLYWMKWFKMSLMKMNLKWKWMRLEEKSDLWKICLFDKGCENVFDSCIHW
jgi:hypothetical protein